MAKPKEREIDRDLEISNLIYAIHLGLDNDPRWWEAAKRLWPELESEESNDQTGTAEAAGHH